MAELLKKIERIFKLRCGANGGARSTDPVAILTDSYRELSNLAAQVSNHAANAPYPAVAERLRVIAQEKQSGAALIRARLVRSGAALEEIATDINSGMNHWERMAQDLSDHSAVETRFLERAARLDEKAPELAALLRNIVESQSHHVKTFMDLIARADPQAQQT